MTRWEVVLDQDETLSPLLIENLPPKGAGEGPYAVLVRDVRIFFGTGITPPASAAYLVQVAVTVRVPTRWAVFSGRKIGSATTVIPASFADPYRPVWAYMERGFGDAGSQIVWATKDVMSELPALVVGDALHIQWNSTAVSGSQIVQVDYEFVPVSTQDWQSILSDTVHRA